MQWGVQSNIQQVVDIAKTKYGYDPGGARTSSAAPNNNDKYFLRTDFNLSPRHQLTYRLNYVDAAANIGSISSTSYLTPDRFYSIRDKNLSNVWQLNSTIGKGFNELRVYYQRERNERGARPEFDRVPVGPRRFHRRHERQPRHRVLLAGQPAESGRDRGHRRLHLPQGEAHLHGRQHNEFYKFWNLFIQARNGDYRFSSIANFNAGISRVLHAQLLEHLRPARSGRVLGPAVRRVCRRPLAPMPTTSR